MKDYEKVIKGLKVCAANVTCEECPYDGGRGGCTELRKHALELFEEMKAQLEQPATACDHESIAQSHSEEIRKLHDKLTDAEITLERTQRELSEAEQELKYLRTIKATTEAFLGVKIDGQM